MGKVELGILEGSGYEVWMKRREAEFCDAVDPVLVQEVNGENVVWARRTGISETGFFDIHHIGCDCLGPVPKGESEVHAMISCKAVQEFLFSTADVAASQIPHLQLLPPYIYESNGEVLLEDEGEELAGLFVYNALRKTVDQADACHGNIRSGVHMNPILQYMLGGLADHQLEDIIDILHYQGHVVRESKFVEIVTADEDQEAA